MNSINMIRSALYYGVMVWAVVVGVVMVVQMVL